ncbi:MAG: GNAT family N-acetyltransferase [Actinomycetota bacterium]
MDVRLVRLDPTSDDHVGGAFAVRAEMLAEANPEGPQASRASVQTWLAGNAMYRRAGVLARHGDAWVGLSRLLFFELEGSRDVAVCNVDVRPAWRRQGVGTQLLREAVAICAAEGKTTLIGSGLDSEEMRALWGAKAGLHKGLVERESMLRLDRVDGRLMAGWVARSAARTSGYRLVHFRGATPLIHRPAVAALNTAMNEAPTDALELEREVWNDADVAAADEFRAARGEDVWTTICQAPDGSPAGTTVIILGGLGAGFGAQANTVVLDGHRRQGIGRWLKADMWSRLRADRPDIHTLLVDNAASNAPMLAINDAMGFQESNRYADWQGAVTDVRARLR